MLYGITTLPKLSWHVAWLCIVFNSNSGLWHLLAWVLPHQFLQCVVLALMCISWCKQPDDEAHQGIHSTSQTVQHMFYLKLDQNGIQSALPSQRLVDYTLWHGGRNKEREVGVVKGHFVMLNCTLWISGCRCTNIFRQHEQELEWKGMLTPIVTTVSDTCPHCHSLPSNSFTWLMKELKIAWSNFL